jgi:hypothetical protein
VGKGLSLVFVEKLDMCRQESELPIRKGLGTLRIIHKAACTRVWYRKDKQRNSWERKGVGIR